MDVWKPLLIGFGALIYVALFMFFVVTTNDCYLRWVQPYSNDRHRWRWPILTVLFGLIAAAFFAYPLGLWVTS